MARKSARKKVEEPEDDLLQVTEDTGRGQQRFCPYQCPFEDTMLKHTDLQTWSFRLERSIARFSNVVTQALSVQAAHAERLTSMEKSQEDNREDHKRIHERIDAVESSLSDKLAEQTKDVKGHIDKTLTPLAARVTALETWRWLIVGGSLVVGGVLSFVIAKIALDWIAKYL